jgi:hypothetical protein
MQPESNGGVNPSIWAAKLGCFRSKRKREEGVCRVAIKVGKVCAIKAGMGLEHRAVEQDDGFGSWSWGMAEVEDVTVGP